MRWLFVIILLIPSLAAAEEAKPLAENPQAEARLKALAVELRCLVCQNQTLADSNAPLAEDLRREVREMIAKDMSDKDIIDFLVTRYGDFVLYRPPLKATTTLLWLGPFLLLIGGGTALVLALRRRQKKLTDVSLSEEERNCVAQLLSEGATRLQHGVDDVAHGALARAEHGWDEHDAAHAGQRAERQQGCADRHAARASARVGSSGADNGKMISK